MQTRTLGQELEVSEQGLGCMGMSAWYGETDEAESIATIQRALELGISFVDTADIYGAKPGENETLVGKAIEGRRDDVVLATKFGNVFEEGKRSINGRPEYVHAALEKSLARLNVDYVDLYYQHRVDKTVPIEETVGAMAELVAAGKVRHLGLSEASPETIRRDAPDRRAAERVLAVDARPRRQRGARHGARPRHRLRRLLAARPRLPDRRVLVA
jgi:aryl-alcohol dehydrogenase-like predicted oxidoreductase